MRTNTSLAVLVGSVVVATAQNAPTVKTINGTFQGAKCSSNDVNSFLGIPYARPPVGDLRFAPPQSYNQTFDNRQATQPPPACTQFNVAFSERGPQSEDCLFVDVWAPIDAKSDSKLPVKVWLYGGGNEAGGISNPTYDGCTASEKVISVSINYRVGPLGFLALDSLGLQGNQGIQDQLLGLQWVQENIEAFGGDAKKVLLFGQSAGAADTFIISSLPQAPSLISAAIMQSGAGDELQTTSDALNATEAFVKALGCSVDDIACVRAASVSAINSSSVAGSSLPQVIVDGTIIPAQPLEAGLKVPAVAGSTTDEGTLFILSQYQASVLTLNSTDYNGFLTKTFGPLAQRVNETYPLSNYTTSSGGPVLAAMSAVVTHSEFRCPTRRFIRQASQDGVPVWTYSFNHTLSCPWYTIIPSYALDLLASTHTAEIPFVFNGTTNMPRPNGTCSLSTGEVALAAKMLGAWDSMAANASPGSDWPQYNTSSSVGVNVIGDEFTIGTVDYSMCDFWDEIQAATANGTSGGGANGTSSGSGSAPTSTAAAWSWFENSVLILSITAGSLVVSACLL
ncbi:hypothetical protein N8I77_007018 [Diaporthe amygdali]|uniref:Carboxylic ester hydrolase n=1 Tax=Phomopsis amygdali TaxID=1214568 RepID=A0AAD9W1G2_PHOAM|nr:hypothetical protein N8I77_007018 [Diaporthe amygdali]